MDQLTIADVNSVRLIEGAAGLPLLARGADTSLVLEACFEARARAVLLYAENLPAAFFDLSSGVAGEVLQKLRTYGGVRLAVVAAPGAVQPSRRFSEMAAEELWKGHFGLFDTAAAARDWLTRA
jgi:Domain of unknown function (DUF4180)